MPVERYKPKQTPHMIQARQDANSATTERLIQAGRDAVVRARRLVADSKDAIARSNSLRGKNSKGQGK